jgi:pilus assembly protein FimV
MNKNALRLLVASALLSPATLFALGLGEIRLNSALNQPFDAEIEVVSASTDELNSLKVAMANEDMFRRYGLDRPNFLSTVSMRVESANAGRPVIKLRSANAVTEPFLSLLVEVSWTGGRVLREYTVLLDPPVFAPTSSQQQVLTPRGGVETPTATLAGNIERSPAPVAPAPAPATTSTAPTANTGTSRSAVTHADNYRGDNYTVRRGDTLSKIAQKISPDARQADRQTMVALYRANPKAFDNNMNVLREGSVLRIPPTADIQAIPTAEASSEVSRQQGIWRSSMPTRAPSGETSERLRLVPAEKGGVAGGTQGSANAAANDQQVQVLQAQLAEARRLLDLRNAELAQMQKAVTKSGPSPAPTPPVTAPKTVASSSSSSVMSQAAVSESSVVEAAETPVAEPVVKPAPAVSKPAPTAAPEASGPGLFEQLSQYGLWLIIAGLVLIGGLIAYFRRRQAGEEQDTGATLTAGDFQAHLSRGPMTRNRFSKEPEVDADTDEHEALQFGSARPAVVAAAAEPIIKPLSEDTLSSETAIHVDQQDALAEADFHMAYGLYDQAADIVKLAIERQPERRELKVKLAEIFFVWGNKDSFLDIARQLQATRGSAEPGEWDKVMIMGKQICPEDPLFSGDIAGSRSADNVDVNLEGGEHHVDIDLYDAPSGDQPKSNLDFELASTGTHINADSGLDFLLDEPQRGVDDEPTREIDGNARTQETPTIESPFLPGQGSPTIREKFDEHAFAGDDMNIERTAEISLDEIGLDVSDMENTGNVADMENTGTVIDETQQIGDNEMTRLATALDRSYDSISETKTMVAMHMNPDAEEESTGNTITVEQIDLDVGDATEQLRYPADATGNFKATQKIDMDIDSFGSSGDTVEQLRPEVSETGIFRATQKIDMDLDYLSGMGAPNTADTVKNQGRGTADVDAFSEQVFGGNRANTDKKSDSLHDTNITELNATELMSGEFQIPEMEPATMSEVGTKLDLARAYMDMGDPDGARSILQEVLDEGNGSQKQEAQRLLDSIG